MTLAKFSDYISCQQPDLIILTARKALCLFELFNYLDIRKPNGEIVSDRVLDLDLDYFKGKKVVVVDDTLILGTTLRAIKDKLIENNIEHKIATFCVDKDNWQKKLIVPDYVGDYYTSQRLLDFCKLLVKAFSLVSIPYLVDFPITNLNKVSRSEFTGILHHEHLTPIKLSVHYYDCNELYTLLLSDEIKRQYLLKVGKSFTNIIEILKVRVFISIIDKENIKVRLVPIVLIKNITEEIINDIFNHIVRFSKHADRIIQLVATPEIRLRFIQYYLSVSLGTLFIDKFINTKVENPFMFKCSESINIFGKEVSEYYESLLKSKEITPIINKSYFSNTINHSDNFKDILEDINVKGFDILKSFQEIFVNLFNKREYPARQELKNGNFDTHFRNRLVNGISFEGIVVDFCKKINLIPTPKIKEVFSICLDICNDLGLSIPIICNSNGVFYRAFRHGELGKRTKGNIFLFHSYLMEFCKVNGYEYKNGFDSILLEKLAVIFYRIGAKNRFIDVTDDYSDPTAINIGFYLMGAVLIENDPNEYFPNSHDDWFLSSHCYNLFTSKKVGETHRYYFDKIPTQEGANTKDNAEFKAKLIGKTLGRAVKLRTKDIPLDTVKDGHPLDLDRLTILATCYSSGDLAMALAAELNIFYNWIKQVDRKYLRYNNIIESSYFSKRGFSTVFQSFNQAYFKFSYSLSDDRNLEKIISDTQNYLKDDDYSYDVWKEYSTKLSIGQEDKINLGEINPKILKSIFDISSFMFKVGNLLYLIQYIIEIYNDVKYPKIRINSKFEFENLNNGNVQTRTIVKKKIKENNLTYGGEIAFLSKPGKNFRGATVGDTVEFFFKGNQYKFKILKITNNDVSYNSLNRFEEYNSKLYNLYSSYNLYGKKEQILPDNYSDIKEKMKELRNKRNPYHLNNELISIIKKLSNEISDAELLLETAKLNYSDSRENLVSLLI
jgi:ribosomal 50S subunit-recycling heat shock protein